MKIRTGFVSNSSSSSFVVWGVTLNNSKLNDMQEEKEKEALKGWKKPENHGSDCQCSKCTPPEVPEIEWYELAEEAGLEYNSEDGKYVGISPDKMKDEETLAQFKQRIADLITKNFYRVDPKDIEFIEFAYYN